LIDPDLDSNTDFKTLHPWTSTATRVEQSSGLLKFEPGAIINGLTLSSAHAALYPVLESLLSLVADIRPGRITIGEVGQTEYHVAVAAFNVETDDSGYGPLPALPLLLTSLMLLLSQPISTWMPSYQIT
jgi:hypothetical protein